MKSRDRVIATVTLGRPDRAPIMHSPVPAALIKYGERLNDIFANYPQDFGPSRLDIPRIEDLAPLLRKGINKDEWCTVWRGAVDGLVGQVDEYPLKSWDDLEDYQFPPLHELTRSSFGNKPYKRMKRDVSSLKEKGYFALLDFNPGNYFERMHWLRGFQNLLKDLIAKPRQLYALADRLLEYCLASLGLVLEAEPDAIFFSDDWGTQERLMVNPGLWREFFKPRYKEMFKLVHDQGVYVYFHSDGYIMDIIPDLAEIGVDMLNPQFSCFKLEELAESLHDKVCVCSDVDRQYLLPKGSAEEVESYVKNVIELFSHGGRGGLICRGEINIDVPLRNVEAMYEAFKKYGRYR